MEPKPLLNKILCASNGSRNKLPWVQNIPSNVIITKDEKLTTTFFIMRMRG
jgi:type IV secretory pathway VirB4 component